MMVWTDKKETPVKMSQRHILTLVAGCALLLVSCDRERNPADAVLASIVERYACVDSIATTSVADSALAIAESCALVAVAFEALGNTPVNTTLPVASDTGLVVNASITTMEEETSSGDFVQSWWVVSLELAEKQYDVDVWISKADGETEIFVVHN